MTDTFDLIVVGGGIAGLNAAQQALKLGLRTAIMEDKFHGGLVMNISDLDGPIKGSGMELAMNLLYEIRNMGVNDISTTATAIVQNNSEFIVQSDEADFSTRAIIVASGAKLRRLGIPGETEFENRGVSQCADCDGPMFLDQDVMVVGGGDSAVQEALVLSQFARVVYLVNRGKSFRAKPDLVNQLSLHANIQILWGKQAESLYGTTALETVTLKNNEDGSQLKIDCYGFFVYIGLDPVCEFVPENVDRDPAGFLCTDSNMQTSLPGLFAIGAVRSGYSGLLSDAQIEGFTAANVVNSTIHRS